MSIERIDALRHSSRKLVRELGILQLDRSLAGPTVQHCHALIEIGHESGITVSKLAELLLLSVSAASRLVGVLLKGGFVEYRDGVDRREKTLYLTPKGASELKNINEQSNAKVKGAFGHLSPEEQEEIMKAMEKYSQALESSRRLHSQVKILTLSTSRTLRRRIIAMVEAIQKGEFQIPVTDEVNACILRAEEDFYYNHGSNFWYAVDGEGAVIGCVGLKRLDAENGELKKYFVDQRFRGRGVAQKLMAALLKAALKHGFKQLWLGTVDNLAAAHRFYMKCGFKRIDEKELPPGFVKCHLDTLFFKGSVDELLV